ncbi:MAG TPA: TadE/TadG family type IV pilus assembly protein [Nitrospiraceae bacterium]
MPRSTFLSRLRNERGGVLLEFAMIALALYLLLAFILDFGRLFFTAQAVQEAARVAARELALVPLPAAATFAVALQDPAVLTNVYDPGRLVIPVTDDASFQAALAALPVVNKALVPLMIYETIGGAAYFRYPGALLSDAASSTGFAVGIPRVVSRETDGVETIEWVAPIEEILPDSVDPATGPFSIASTGPQQGLVAIRVNYPFQAVALSGFRQGPEGPFEPGGLAIQANDDAVQVLNPGGQDPIAPAGGIGPYAGTYGLGGHLAWAQTRRPFRKLLTAQAIFRREVLL